MNCAEVAAALLKTPAAGVLLKVGNDWVEVCGVGGTGDHRNAVTLLCESTQGEAITRGLEMLVENQQFGV